MKRICILILFFMASSQATYAAQELRFDFSYNQSIYGSERQNKLTTRTYAVGWNFFLSQLTALEINFTHSDNIARENNNIRIGSSDFSVTASQNKVERRVYGLGLRQFFAHRRALIRPSLSLGYAKQFVQDRTDYTILDDSDDSTFALEGPSTQRRDDSVFASLALELRLSQTIALTGSVHTVFKAFEFNRAGDNLRYALGLRWFIL